MKQHKGILTAFGRAVAVLAVLLNAVSVSAATTAPTMVSGTPVVETGSADDTKTMAPLPIVEKRSTPTLAGTATSAAEEADAATDLTMADAAPRQLVYDAYLLPTGRCWGYCILSCPCTVIVFF